MGKTINQLTTNIGASLNANTELEGQLSGSASTGKFTLTQLKAALDALVGGGDVTPPTILTLTLIAGESNKITVGFDEAVTITTAGWSALKNGVAWAISSVAAGTGFQKKFTMASDAVAGDVVTLSYNSATGSTTDSSANELVSFTNGPVTNYLTAVTVGVVDDEFIGAAATDILSHTPTVGGIVSKVYSSTGVGVTNGDGTAKEAAPHSTASYYTYANSFAGENQKVILRVKKTAMIGVADFDVVEIQLRADTSGALITCYYLQLIDAGTPSGWTMGLYKKVAGVNTAIGSPVAMNAYLGGTYVDIDFLAIGSTLIARANGVTLITETDATLTAGRKAVIGFYSVNPTANQFIVGRFQAENILATVYDDMIGTAANDIALHTPAIGGAITKAFSSTGVGVTNGDGTAKVAAPFSSTVYYMYANAFTGADQRITCVAKKAGSVASGEIDVLALWLRVDPGASADMTGYQVQLINTFATGLLCYFYKCVNGVNTDLGVADNIDVEFVDGLYHELVFEVIGNTLNFRVDGALIITDTDATLTAGRRVAFQPYSTVAHANTFIIDSITAENL